MVTLRIDRDVLDWLRDQGKGYQTRINQALRVWYDAVLHEKGMAIQKAAEERAAKKAAAQRTAKKRAAKRAAAKRARQRKSAHEDSGLLHPALAKANSYSQPRTLTERKDDADGDSLHGDGGRPRRLSPVLCFRWRGSTTGRKSTWTERLG